MIDISQISRPTLLLNEDVARMNLSGIIRKFASKKIAINPHFKTHQSHEIGRWFQDFGFQAITVSSVKMAEYFLEDGWKDISIAFPFNIRELEAIHKMPVDIHLTLNVVTPDTVNHLAKYLKRPVQIMIEVDAGYGRTGVSVDDYNMIEQILSTINRSGLMSFYGFYIHPGHTYDTNSMDQIGHIYEQTLQSLSKLKQRYIGDWPDLKISLGDTPGCTLMEEFDGIDEVRPGNFIFYDMVMHHLNVCSLDQIAVAVAVPIVDKQESRKEIVFHGGAIHFSKDYAEDMDGRVHYGWPCILNENGWVLPDGQSYVRKLSQEHGIARCSDAFFNQVSVGDCIAVLPVHSCLTADCMKSYLSLTGEKITMMQL